VNAQRRKPTRRVVAPGIRICDRLDNLWTSRWLCFALRTAEAACLDKQGNQFGAHRPASVTNRTSCEPQADGVEANFGVKELTMLSLIKPLHLALDLHDACTQGDLSGCYGQHSLQQGGYSSAHGNKKA
jgi:hypothetical protein